MDHTSGADYVRMLQVQSGSARLLARRPSTIPDVSGARELMRDQLGIQDARHGPVGVSLDSDLEQIAAQIRPFIANNTDLGGGGPTPVTMAGIITGSPNALAVRAPDGRPVILFDASLGALLAVLSLATVILDVGIHDPRFERHPDLKGRLPENSYVAAVAAEAVTGFLSRRPRIPDLRPLASDVPGLIFAALSLAHGEIRFAVAHEFGHVALSHFDDGVVRPRYVHLGDAQPMTVEMFTKGHEQELEADEFGANLCSRLVQEVDPPDFLPDYPGVYGLGPELFFLHIGLLEGANDVKVDAGSHPPAMERLVAVRTVRSGATASPQAEAAQRCEVAVRALGRLI